MAASIIFTFRGPPEQKHTVRVPPLAQLKGCLVDVCAKLRPPLDAMQCAVMFHGKPVDVNTPFRLLNIPSGSKMEIVQGAAQDAQAGAEQCSVSGTEQNTSRPYALAPTREDCAGATGAGLATASGKAAPGPHVVASTQQQSQNTFWASLGIDRELKVFSQHAVEAAAAATTGRGSAMRQQEVDDAFFELTSDDWVLLQRDLAAKRKAEGSLKTREVREAEVHARAASFGSVPVRVHFPDGIILQASFAAHDPLRLVYDVVQRCLTPDVAAKMLSAGCKTRVVPVSSVYLYTTPPKHVLKDQAQTMYEAGLVPAAHLYFHPPEPATGQQRTYMRPEVLAAIEDYLPMALGDLLNPSSGASPMYGGAPEDEPEPARAPGRTVAAGAMGSVKTPKWMKLSSA